jgi:hypothetical protein
MWHDRYDPYGARMFRAAVFCFGACAFLGYVLARVS